MRRRFGRGRKQQGGDSGAAPIDAAYWLTRMAERRTVGAGKLEAVELEGVPSSFAVLGTGENGNGAPLGVAFSPTRGSDAALAALAWAAARSRGGADAVELYAVAPDWSHADRRRLSLMAPQLTLQCVVASDLLEAGSARVEAGPLEEEPFEPELLAGILDRADESQLCRRALAGLEGLAAKHGGALRGIADRVELMVLGRRAAALIAEPRNLRIEVYEPERATLPLAGAEALATSLDRLEGLLRKLFNDRRTRGSESELRAILSPLLERAAEISVRNLWPLSGAVGERVDWVGMEPDGRCAVGAALEQLDLPALAQVLDGVALAPRALTPLARRLGRAALSTAPRLWIAAKGFDEASLDAISVLGLEIELFDAAPRRSGDWGLQARAKNAAPTSAPKPARSSPARPPTARRAPGREVPAAAAASGSSAASSALAQPSSDAPASAGDGSRRFEEVSLFDLDEDNGNGNGDGGEEGPKRRRRRRRGRRGRGGDGEKSDSNEGASDDSGPRPDARSGSDGPRSERNRSRRAPKPAATEEDDADDVDLVRDDDDALVVLADVEGLDEPDLVEEEDDDSEDGEDDRESDRARRERELRRRARLSKPPEPPPPPRRRAAFVAHADRTSLLTAVILARDVRMVEGFWVYPQSDLMTFFRSIATDLAEETPIFLVGFAASPPARDTLQSASLYKGRLDWFDHHDWPPEDLEALRATLGEDHVHIEPGAESSLAAVIAERNRRSRFSDKLMELVTGRFSQHDFERWGRWWWHRSAELAAKPGDRKSDVSSLLEGRPSDLAKAVARAEEPPLPEELAYVSGRDFRLVHFGGLSLVVVEAPEPMDLHLCARIARERYEAPISLAMVPGRDLVVLGADDTRTRHSLDLGALASHLATKHAWIEALADDDHVARVRVSGLHDRADRLDDLITEIAMGRSIIEG